MAGPTEVYCDESGFSGNRLSDAASPFFVYSSVAIGRDRAAELVQRIMRDYRLQGKELKGSNLLKNNLGRKAVASVLAETLPISQSVAYHKQFALACKLFEYIYEPVIANSSSVFYNIGFHKFVSNLLYVEMVATRGGVAQELLLDFETMMRNADVSGLRTLFGLNRAVVNPTMISEQTLGFAMAHRDAILEELESVKRSGSTGNWVLDLSDTSVNSLMSYWGERHSSLDVFCDMSKPLQAVPHGFDWMVDRKDKVYITINGRTRRITYNLARPIQVVDSKDYPGIQLADVLSSALGYALRNQDDKEAGRWLRAFVDADSLHDDCVFPEFDTVDLDDKSAIRNAIVLAELMERTEEGRDILAGISQFVEYVTLCGPGRAELDAYGGGDA